jgi:hypothetical protein
MRHLRLTLTLAVTACVLAVAATPALAEPHFTSTGQKTTGKSLGPQSFTLAAFKITCEKATAKSGETTPLESETFATSVRFIKCKTRAKLGENEFFLPTKFQGPVVFEYKASGLGLEIGPEGEEEEGSVTINTGGAIEIKVSAIKCLISVPYQTLPVKIKKTNPLIFASFENVPTPKGMKTVNELEIKNTFKQIHFEFENAVEAGQCSEFKASEEERKTGKYEGNMIEKTAMDGSITFVP